MIVNKSKMESPITCDVTIAICTYNRLHTLPKTLDSLKCLRGGYTFEILVVNGPSTDGTTEFLEGLEDISVYENPVANLSISRNIGIANAWGRYIAFIDDDAVPEPDWLSLIIEKMDADPDLAAVGGFIRDANGIAFQNKYVFCDVLGEGVPCDNEDYMTFLRKEKRYYPSLTGTNTTFRASSVREINGFDEVFAYFLDETDVNKRMDDAGMSSVVLPEAEIHHKYAPSHLRTAKRVSLNMHPTARSIAYFSARHGAPEVGWEAVIDRLKTFYEKEFGWKLEAKIGQDISSGQFEELMHQTGRGIMDGIDLAFELDGADFSNRLVNRVDDSVKKPPMRKMRQADDRLRLCMFSQDHAGERFGGIGRWTNLVATGLAERGHEVTVIGELQKRDGPEYCDFTDGGFWSHNISHFEREAANEVDCFGLPSTLANAAKRRRAEMLRVMPRRQFQVASSPIWDVEGAAVMGAGDIPTVLSLHTCAGLMLESKPEWRENESYYQDHVLRVINAEILALRRTPLILANSRAVMKDISHVYGIDLMERPHMIVPHGIEDIDDPDDVLDAKFASLAEHPNRNIRVMFLGRIETRKGIKDLVSVVRSLIEQGIPIHLDLVGDRTDEVNYALVRDLMEQFPDQVVHHGYLKEQAVDALMRSADIFFGPSLYESFGLIYVEAMRYSTPCVGYSTGGVTEVIEHGVDGILSPLNDRSGLEKALTSLVSDNDLRKKMSRAARRSFENKFHYSLMAERLEKAYMSVS